MMMQPTLMKVQWAWLGSWAMPQPYHLLRPTVVKVSECLFVGLSVGNLLGMKKGEVVFVIRFMKENMLWEAFVVVGMRLGRMGVAFVVVVVECWDHL